MPGPRARSWVDALILLLLVAFPRAGRADDAPLPPPVVPEVEAPPPPAEPSGFQLGRPNGIAILNYALPPGIDGRVPGGYSGVWTPKQNLENLPGTFASFRQDATLAFPLWIEGPNVLVGSLSVRNTLFETDVTLPTSNLPFPDQLWEVRPGVTYIRDLGDGWKIGGGVSVGSASDRPYASIREVAPTLIAFLRQPAQGNDAWQYSLTYIPVSLIRFPLPGLAYEWNPSDRLQIALGVPFSIRWLPTDTVRFDFAYLPPRSVRTQLTWQVLPVMSVFGGFEWVNNSYLLADRIDREDFFTSNEMRLPLGVRFELGSHCTLDLGGGYAFNRVFFTEDDSDDEDRDRVEVNPGGYLMLRLAARF